MIIIGQIWSSFKWAKWTNTFNSIKKTHCICIEHCVFHTRLVFLINKIFMLSRVYCKGPMNINALYKLSVKEWKYHQLFVYLFAIGFFLLKGMDLNLSWQNMGHLKQDQKETQMQTMLRDRLLGCLPLEGITFILTFKR